MRNPADDIDAKIERALEIAGCARRTEIAVLRKGDQLEIEIGLHSFLDVEQRLDRQQSVVADVDIAADREQALRHRQIAISKRALRHRLMGEKRLSSLQSAIP